MKISLDTICMNFIISTFITLNYLQTSITKTYKNHTDHSYRSSFSGPPYLIELIIWFCIDNTKHDKWCAKLLGNSLHFYGGETFRSLLVAGYFLLVAGYFLLVARYFLLVARYFLLVARYFLLVAGQEILKNFLLVKLNKRFSILKTSCSEKSVKYRSRRSRMFFKIAVLEKFATYTGKHLCWNLFLIKQQS